MQQNGTGQGARHSDDIMTLKEIAGYLKVSEKTVFRMLQAGELPGAKVSNQWRFVRSVIDDWLDSRMYGAPKRDLLQVMGTAQSNLPISRLVTARRIVLNLIPGRKRDILAQLVQTLARTAKVPAPDALTDELLRREEVVSTAIGRGTAFPHVRDPEDLPVAQPCIVLGICASGTDFGSLDGGKTYVFALPCARSQVAHLRMMAQLSFLFRSAGVLRALRAAKTKRAVLDILAATDAEISRRR